MKNVLQVFAFIRFLRTKSQLFPDITSPVPIVSTNWMLFTYSFDYRIKEDVTRLKLVRKNMLCKLLIEQNINRQMRILEEEETEYENSLTNSIEEVKTNIHYHLCCPNMQSGCINDEYTMTCHFRIMLNILISECLAHVYSKHNSFIQDNFSSFHKILQERCYDDFYSQYEEEIIESAIDCIFIYLAYKSGVMNEVLDANIVARMNRIEEKNLII